MKLTPSSFSYDIFFIYQEITVLEDILDNNHNTTPLIYLKINKKFSL